MTALDDLYKKGTLPEGFSERDMFVAGPPDPIAGGGMRYPLAKWIVLQSILAAGIAAAFVSGALDEMLTPGPLAAAAGGLSALIILGLLLLAAGRRSWVQWLAPKMPAFALIGTIVGIKMAIGHAGTDQAAALEGVATALVSTALGLVGWLVLSFNLKAITGRSEDE